MFLPIGDDNRDRQRTPWINYLLILTNILVFIFLQDWGHNTAFTLGYATVPAEILSGHDIITSSQLITDPVSQQVFVNPGLTQTNIPVLLTLFSGMFMHGSLLHLLGNMLYLWIFGDNLEDALGHLRYLFFYLLCGVLAGLTHVFSTALLGQNQLIPSLGASGAIAGVLGGYIILFPRSRIRIWLFFVFTIRVPAFLAVGLWFLLQVYSGASGETGGIAYAAHIGGFIAGIFASLKLFNADKYRDFGD
jgi:membrane associated rhomboid family serine protease